MSLRRSLLPVQKARVAKAKAKARERARQREAPGKGRKYCRACRRWLDLAVFGANDALCKPDKTGPSTNILKLAKKQGPKAQEWATAVKAL